MSRLRRIRLVAFALVCLAHGVARTAHAEDQATEMARLHFQNGLRLHDQSPPDYAGALVEFEASYRDKPAPSTRLNMAICFRALRRYPEAVDALRDVIANPGALGPDALRAAQKAIDEMSVFIGFLHVELTGESPADLVIYVDGEPRAPEKNGVIRVASGTHMVAVRGRGIAEPPPMRVVIVGARDTTAAFTITKVETQEGRIVFRGTWPEVVDVDGAPTSTKAPAIVSAGVHRISMRRGGRLVWMDVNLDAGQEQGVDIPADDPGALALDRRVETVFATRPWYVRGGPSVSGELLRFSQTLGEPAEGTLRTLYGPAFSVAAGRNVSEHFAVEVAGDVGTAWRSYGVTGTALNAQLDTFSVTPSLRFRTTGSARFTAAAGLGVAGRTFTLEQSYASGSKRTLDASGTTATLFLDAGADVNIGRVFIHGVVFANGFRLAPITGVNDFRPFEGTLSLRTGARAEVGFEF